MIVPFKKLPKAARLWVFPSSRKFYKQELPEIQKLVEDFCEKWCDNHFELSFELKNDRFLIFAIDDTDKSLTLANHDELTLFIQKLEKKYDIVLLDRINVCYKQGEFVQYKDLKEFKKMIKAKGVSQKTTVFNNMVTTVGEYKYDWEINIMNSWLGRFF